MLLIPLFSRLQLGCIWSFVMFLICLSTVSCGIYLDWSLWICLWLFCVCDSFLYYCFAFVDTILRLIFIDNFRMLREHIVIYRFINKPITIWSFFFQYLSFINKNQPSEAHTKRVIEWSPPDCWLSQRHIFYFPKSNRFAGGATRRSGIPTLRQKITLPNSLWLRPLWNRFLNLAQFTDNF